MLPSDFHGLFAVTAGIAGTLIGLLFVAISVAHVDKQGEEFAAHRVRASAALTAFTNALSVSLFSLVPGIRVGSAAVGVSVIGLLFVIASLLSIRRSKNADARQLRNTIFLLSLAATFIIQLVAGVVSRAHPDRTGPVQTIAILVIVCFLIGIARSWELIGGPSVKLSQELGALARAHSESDSES
jgi:hypothetical protein